MANMNAPTHAPAHAHARTRTAVIFLANHILIEFNVMMHPDAKGVCQTKLREKDSKSNVPSNVARQQKFIIQLNGHKTGKNGSNGGRLQPPPGGEAPLERALAAHHLHVQQRLQEPHSGRCVRSPLPLFEMRRPCRRVSARREWA